MGAWSGFVRESPSAVYQKAQGAVTAKGLELKVALPGQSLTAEGGRAYRLVVLIILIILLLFGGGGGYYVGRGGYAGPGAGLGTILYVIAVIALIVIVLRLLRVM